MGVSTKNCALAKEGLGCNLPVLSGHAQNGVSRSWGVDGGGRWRRDDGHASGGWQRGRSGCVPVSILKGTPLPSPHGASEP